MSSGRAVYLGRTADRGITYSKYGEHTEGIAGQDDELTSKDMPCGFADSDFGPSRNTTGYIVMLAGGAIGHSSKRQHCVAMSTCEAELIALATLGVEMEYYLGLYYDIIQELQTKPAIVFTDNTGAFNLCWRTSAGNQTKHVARRIFKMREMRCGGKVHPHHCEGEINPADMLTKPLQRQKLERFASYAMNTSFSKTVDAFVEYTGELKKSAERSKKLAERSAMMLSTTRPKLAAFVGMFAKDKIPSDGSEIRAPKTAPNDEVDLPRWLLDAPIKLKRVSYGRFDAATMQAEVSELTPFETSIKMGLNDSTTK